jgi:1,4-alpha-glucan branching enzyme
MKVTGRASIGKKMETNGARLFAYSANPNARQVYLVGDFNGWDPTTLPLSKRGETFVKRVNLTPGEHQYKFLVDGEWQTDPSADVQVPNGVGSLNSVVRV